MGMASSLSLLSLPIFVFGLPGQLLRDSLCWPIDVPGGMAEAIRGRA